MGHYLSIALVAVVFLESSVRAAEDVTVTLYQVGKNGRYCLSLNKDETGCVSGVDQAGNTINVLDMTRGKKVVFENLSDAPHDMKFSGRNAENMPAQGPGAGPVNKQMTVEDTNKESVTCSYHGFQVGVGYRVLDNTGKAKEQQSEHRDRRQDLPEGADNGQTEQPTQGIVRTGLADVSKEILAKGNADDVEKLVGARPELLEGLKAVRPLLANEISANQDEAKPGQVPGSDAEESRGVQAELDGESDSSGLMKWEVRNENGVQEATLGLPSSTGAEQGGGGNSVSKAGFKVRITGLGVGRAYLAINANKNIQGAGERSNGTDAVQQLTGSPKKLGRRLASMTPNKETPWLKIVTPTLNSEHTTGRGVWLRMFAFLLLLGVATRSLFLVGFRRETDEQTKRSAK